MTDKASIHIRTTKGGSVRIFPLHLVEVKVRTASFATCCTCDTQATGQGPDWAHTFNRAAPQGRTAANPDIPNIATYANDRLTPFGQRSFA